MNCCLTFARELRERDGLVPFLTEDDTLTLSWRFPAPASIPVPTPAPVKPTMFCRIIADLRFVEDAVEG